MTVAIIESSTAFPTEPRGDGDLNMFDVLEEVIEITPKAIVFGRALGIDRSTLESIEYGNRDSYRQLQAVIHVFLMQGQNCTWKAIIDALNKIGERAVARRVEAAHFPKQGI